MKSNISITTSNPEILEQATYTNSYSVFIPWSKSIGFKTHSLKYQEHKPSSNVATDFIANLGFSRADVESESSIMGYLSSTGTTMLSFANHEDNSIFKKTPLPKCVPLRMSLESVISSRRSIRQFTGDDISLSFLTTIIKAGCGITATNSVDLENGAITSLTLRSTPSAGGIYPVDIYIVALNVENLERAIHQYNSSKNYLVKLYNKEIVTEILECFSVSDDQISLTRAAFICLLVGSAPKSMYKYGNLGAGFTIHEVGSISQNIHLAVTSLGLGSVDCASYFIDEAHKVLNLDGIYKHLFHTIVVGVSQ